MLRQGRRRDAERDDEDKDDRENRCEPEGRKTHPLSGSTFAAATTGFASVGRV
jgi:hypothetical protein